jgi:hypothetical protein
LFGSNRFGQFFRAGSLFPCKLIWRCCRDSIAVAKQQRGRWVENPYYQLFRGEEFSSIGWCSMGHRWDALAAAHG